MKMTPGKTRHRTEAPEEARGHISLMSLDVADDSLPFPRGPETLETCPPFSHAEAQVHLMLYYKFDLLRNESCLHRFNLAMSQPRF